MESSLDPTYLGRILLDTAEVEAAALSLKSRLEKIKFTDFISYPYRSQEEVNTVLKGSENNSSYTVSYVHAHPYKHTQGHKKRYCAIIKSDLQGLTHADELDRTIVKLSEILAKEGMTFSHVEVQFDKGVSPYVKSSWHVDKNGSKNVYLGFSTIEGWNTRVLRGEDYKSIFNAAHPADISLTEDILEKIELLSIPLQPGFVMDGTQFIHSPPKPISVKSIGLEAYSLRFIFS